MTNTTTNPRPDGDAGEAQRLYHWLHPEDGLSPKTVYELLSTLCELIQRLAERITDLENQRCAGSGDKKQSPSAPSPSP